MNEPITTTLLWVGLGLLAALANTGSPLVQEKFKGDAFSVAIWVKIGAVVLTLPFVIYFGLPTEPKFYLFAAISGVIWAISDVIYFRAVADVGAGVVSRLIPSAVLFSFLIWFLINPDLLSKYIDNPIQGGGILLVICCATFFAMNLKSCPISMRGFQLVWFVILAASIGPLVEKISLGDTPKPQMPFAFVFVQALMMIGMWGIYATIKKPIDRSVFMLKSSWKTGLLISLFTTTALCLRFTALQYVEHPALLSVLLFTDAFWIILYYRLTKRQDNSKIWAGLGLVGCAASLVLIKSF
jgi:uncharacterized membrane protein